MGVPADAAPVAGQSSRAATAADRARFYRHAAGATLLAAFALRAILAGRGGQMFWPDEGRYVAAQQAAHALLAGEWRQALTGLLRQVDHLLFKIAAVLPALLQETWHTGPWLPALFFAAASTWMIAMVGRAAAALGADERERFLAVLLAASTACLFYYSRHFFPYDLALAFCLQALVAAAREPATSRSSFATGVWAALGFLTYNGYWTLAATVLVLHVLAARPHGGAARRRTAAAAAGLLMPIAVVLIGGGLLGLDLPASYLGFARQVAAADVSQGDFRGAWRYVAEYFWSAEHGVVVLWALALVWGLVGWLRRRAPRRAARWLVLIMLLYAALVIPSSVVPVFTVYARHVRVLAPFLCLLTASMLASWWESGAGRARIVAALVGTALLQSAWNFLPVVRQVFPPEFRRIADAVIKERLRRDGGVYQVLNCQFLHDPRWAVPTPPGDTVIRQARHPFEYEPYLYEGYPEAERAAFRARERSMRVVRLGGPPLPTYPGGIKLTIHLFEFTGPPEPLLGTGVTGRGDLLFIRYEGGTRVRLGFEHWGDPPALSAPFTLDPAVDHTVLISLGALFPPVDGAAAAASPAGRSRHNQLSVAVDGQPMLSRVADCYPAQPDEIAVGLNLIGASSAMDFLNAEIKRVEPVPPEALPGVIPSAAYPGPLRLQLHFDGPPDRGTQPLVSTGVTGRGDLFYLRILDDGHLRLGLDHWDSGAMESEPLAFDWTKDLVLLVSLGSLLPPEGDALFLQRPNLLPLKHRLVAILDGTVALDRPAAFHRSAPDDVVVGYNQIRSSVAPERATAQITWLERVSPGALPGAAGDATYPGPLRITLRFDRQPAQAAQPILSTGVTGRGDLLYLRSLGEGRACIGLDHWQGGAVESAPLAFDWTKEHVLVVALGSLLPPEGDALFVRQPALRALQRRLFVAVDGQVVLDRPADFHAAAPNTITVGYNLINASSAGPNLDGRIVAREPFPAERLPAAQW